MIIGINGRVGAGKDTVGNLIQSFLQKGEDTEIGMPTWEIKKFAAKLKTIASLLTGIPVDKFEDQEFKKKRLGKEWAVPADQLEGEIAYHGMTVRGFLQKLGTDAIRDNLHTETWVNALFADYNPLGYWPEGAYQREVPNWIITDCRFPNEAQAIKDRGGLVIRVVRPGSNMEDLHPSEIALDSWTFDQVIDNSGSMNHLAGEVKQFLKINNLL